MAERAKKSTTAEKKNSAGTPQKAARAKADEPRPSSQKKKTPVQAKAPRAPGKPRKQTAKTVRFALDAPQAREVCVAGSFNDWNPAANSMQQDEAGQWICAVLLESGEHEYRFVVDGDWCDDPANALRRWNEFGTQNSILIL